MHADQADMRSVTMFPKENALPGPQRQPAATDGDGEIDGSESAADVSGHIVFPLGRVDEKRIAVGHEAGEEFFQVPPHVGVGVLLNEQRSGGMADVESQEAILEAVLRNPGGRLVGEFVEATVAS